MWSNLHEEVAEVPKGECECMVCRGALKPNLRCGSISSLRVSRTDFSAENVINGVSRHPLLADIVGGVDSFAIHTQFKMNLY